MSLFGIEIGDAVDTVGRAAGAVGAVVGNMGEEISDFYTGEDSDHQRYLHEVQERGNTQREGIYADEARARAQLPHNGGVLPPTVMPEAFDAMTHEGILAHVNALSASRVTTSGEAFHSIQNRIGALGYTLGAQLRSALSTEWEGTTADGAAAAVSGYTAAMSHLTASLTVVSGKLAEAGSGFEQTALMVPPASSVGGADILRVATSFVSPAALVGTLSDVMAEKEATRQQAVAVMKTVYTPVVIQSDTGIPVLPPPLPPTTGAGASGDSYAGGGAGLGGAAWPSTVNPASPTVDIASGTGTSAPGTRPADTGAASAEPTGNGAAGAANSGSGALGTGNSGTGNSGSTSTPAQTQGASAAQPGVTPGAVINGAGGSRGRMSPFGASGGAGGSAGRAGSGVSTSAPYGVAAGPLGPPGAAGAGTAPGASGAAGVAAARGGYGSGAMMPGGGARGDNDTEHSTPGYLVSVDNGDDLIGVLPPVAPPVIGS